MFVENDLEATPVMVGNDHEPIILDRLQAQLHALASDTDTFTSDPHPSDCPSEEWTAWLAGLDLDKRQGEISELMINNNNIRSVKGLFTSIFPFSSINISYFCLFAGKITAA